MNVSSRKTDTMLLQYFVGILIIINPGKPLHALEQCQVQSLSVYGHRLANHVISTKASSGLTECVMLCSDESRCKSLNFRVNDKSCDLNDADRFTHPQDYGPKHGIVYMDSYVRHRKILILVLVVLTPIKRGWFNLIQYSEYFFLLKSKHVSYSVYLKSGDTGSI